MKSVLVVDDERGVRFGISKYLESEGYRVSEAACLDEARRILSLRGFDAILLDVNLPDGDGISFLEELRLSDPTTPVIIITGHGTIPMAVEAIRLGADHFLTKPVEPQELGVLLSKSMQIGSLRRENRALKERPHAIAPCLGESQALKKIQPLLAAAYRYPSPVLLRGETGTGKGLVARLIHERSPQRLEPFVELNCAGLKGEFLETELFGHSRGAFTGAVESKVGLLERAHRGTLFLDEIGDMDLAVQAKFLKVLEEKRFRPLGRTEQKVSDFRLICATHQDLEAKIAGGDFRKDLYYRINTLSITLPTLRERLEEMPELVRHLLAFIVGGREIPSVPAVVVEKLRAYDWPGNLRELHNALERAWIISDGRALKPEHFAALLPGLRRAGPEEEEEADVADLRSAEKAHIRKVLVRSGGRVPEAAKLLGISRATLYRKMAQHGLHGERER